MIEKFNLDDNFNFIDCVEYLKFTNLYAYLSVLHEHKRQEVNEQNFENAANLREKEKVFITELESLTQYDIISSVDKIIENKYIIYLKKPLRGFEKGTLVLSVNKDNKIDCLDEFKDIIK